MHFGRHREKNDLQQHQKKPFYQTPHHQGDGIIGKNPSHGLLNSLNVTTSADVVGIKTHTKGKKGFGVYIFFFFKNPIKRLAALRPERNKKKV